MDINYCINCGQELQSNDKFCSSCGWKIENSHNTLYENNSVRKTNMTTTADEKGIYNTILPSVKSNRKVGQGTGVVLIMIILAILGFILLQQLKGGMFPLP